MERFFPPGEPASDWALREKSPATAFLRVATREAAFLKAIGVGFADAEVSHKEPGPDGWDVYELS